MGRVALLSSPGITAGLPGYEIRAYVLDRDIRMTMAIGVLCARVRVEEKRIMAELERAGVLTMPVPPAALPLPPDPTLQDVQAIINESPGCQDARPLVMIDRVQNRAVGRIINRLLRQAGITMIDAGVASRRNRLQVASVWDAAGVPRPRSLVAFSESTAMMAANQLGYPATMFPMLHSSAAASLPDADTADAVIEHRVVLGTDEEEIVMLQAGALVGDTEHYLIHTAGYRAVAVDGEVVPPTDALALAGQAAEALTAGTIAIEVACINHTWVAWDAVPLADFRKAMLLGETSVEEAISAHALAKLQDKEQEVRDVALTH